MNKELILSSVALALFIVCPRMAGIVHVICKNSQLPIYKTAFLASVIAIPLILLMVWAFSRLGVTGALIFCIFTDFVCAYLLKEISFKASLETIIIALFVLVGVKIAPMIVNLFVKN